MQSLQPSEKIKLIRNGLSLTMREMGLRLGVSQGYVSEIEAGKKQPSETLIKLLICDCSVNIEWWETGRGEIFTSGEGKAQNNFSGSAFDQQLMQNLIQWVEEGCQEHGVKIKPAAKAKLLIKLYNIFSKENPDVQRDEVVRHLRLVA